MSKQTAVEWLELELKKLPFVDVVEVFQKAKSMEKEQIEEAWDKRCSHGVVSQTWHIETKNGEQYYNETYGGEQ
jgi:hypothetical protein